MVTSRRKVTVIRAFTSGALWNQVPPSQELAVQDGLCASDVLYGFGPSRTHGLGVRCV